MGVGKRRVTAALWRLLACVPFVATCACVLWILSQSPFTAPTVDRTLDDARLRIEAAMAREVTLDWLTPRMEAAIAGGDLTQIETLVDLAIRYKIAVPADLKERLQETVDAQSGLIATTRSCAACAIDLTNCASLSVLAACGVTFELTPGGDLNALRRGAVAYTAGDDVDQLDLGLAIVGLGATGAVLATGGTSYSVKLATSLLRIAKRMGTLTPALARQVTTLMQGAIHWDQIGALARLQVRPAALVDATKLSELAGLGRTLDRVRANTSLADTLSLMRHVDGPADAARLARASDIMGPQTRAAFDVLGKSRVFRAMVRLSDLAVSAVVALYLMALQFGLFVAQQTGNVGLRAMRRRKRRNLRARA